MHPISKELQKHYESCFKQHGPSSEGVDWGTKKNNILLRHQNMARLFEGEKETSVLDIGCGYGAFYEFLQKQGRKEKIRYTGIDIVESMVAYGAKQFKDAQFVHGDFSDDSISLNADYVICSGILTQKLSASILEMDAYARALLIKMFRSCNKGIAFNIMTDKVNYMADNLYYKNPSEMLGWCMNELSPRIKLDHSYPMFEYTLYVYK